MKLKVRIAGENKDSVVEALKNNPIFIKDEYVDVKEGPELDWDNLYFVKIGNYYLTDIDYGYDEEYYKETIVEIGVSPIDDEAMHIEQWEIEYVQNALKREIEII